MAELRVLIVGAGELSSCCIECKDNALTAPRNHWIGDCPGTQEGGGPSPIHGYVVGLTEPQGWHRL